MTRGEDVAAAFPLAAATAAVVAGTVAFAVYATTLLPGVDLGDSGGFQAAVLWPETSARRAYPLYYALARPFVGAVSSADPARGLNLFSAVTAAAAVSLLCYAAAAVTRSLLAGAAAALLLAFSFTFWTQAIIAEVYGLHLALVAACLVALHAFPVWSPIEAESWLSYKSTILTSFIVRFGARAGAVMLDELGCYGGDESVTARYLDAALHTQLANGGSGGVVWCWQDFTSRGKPFELRPQERATGLIDENGRGKPALEVLQSFASTAESMAGLRPEAATVAILARNVPDERTGGYLGQPLDSAIGVFYAFALAKRAHLPCELADAPADHHRLLICPSLRSLRQSDLDTLHQFVERGGHVYASIADHLHGFPGQQLTGVRLHDFKRSAEQSVAFEHRGYRYRVRLERRAMLSAIVPLGADVICMFDDRSPAVTRFAVGRGQFIFLNAPFEESLNEAGLLTSEAWHTLYAWLAHEAGVVPALTCDSPDVECAVLTGNGRTVTMLINHAGEERTIIPTIAGREVAHDLPPVTLPPKATWMNELSYGDATSSVFGMAEQFQKRG